VSEDCLYLNVWVPKTHPRIRKSAVLVWIFGGGFYSGTTTLNLYDGKILAAENNLIVVSIGYRVGALGFLSLGHPSTPGNAGLFDQLMGLDWVQNNIRYFGGDPNNVTIFGESAGSVSVSLHLLSPLSRSKFQRAIIQSGVAQMPWATHDMKEARRRAVELAVVILACPQTDDMEALAECLRSIKPQTLVDNQWVSRGIIQFPFLPVIDGAFLVETPLMSLKRRSFKRCPLLMGSNLNEASFFLIYELPKFLTLNSTTMTRQQFLESINELFFHYPQYPQTINSIGLDAIAFQYSNWLDPEDKLANIRMLDGAVGDCHFTCHVNHFGHRYATAGENVYMYYFTERYKSNPWPEWMGVLHGDEILFTMGEVLKSGGNFTNDEKELSRKMMKYWTNFAKSGDPNRSPGEPSLDEWPLHTPQGKEYLELNSKHLRLPPAERERSVGRGPRAKECAFWVEYLPHLIATTEDISETEKEWKLQFHEWSTQYIVDWKIQYDNFIGSKCENGGS
jgi:acetylcholinesterase